jgi:hypothetical protein
LRTGEVIAMTTELLDDLPEQIVARVDWQKFKAIQAAFDGIPEIKAVL